MTTEEYQPEPIPAEILQAMRAEEVEPTEEAKEPVSGVEDLSDLFQAPLPTDSDIDSEDLTSVSEEDVYGDGGADMSDLTDVDEEEILEVGSEQEEAPPQRYRFRKRPKSIRRSDNETPSMGGLRL